MRIESEVFFRLAVFSWPAMSFRAAIFVRQAKPETRF